MLNVVLRRFGQLPYQTVWDEMRSFTNERISSTDDEIWLLEHDPVFTLGLNGSTDHLLEETQTPVIRSDRGGQVTWHGPGQLMVYTLLDLNRMDIGIKTLVSRLEQAVIETVKQYGFKADVILGAPGVYVEGCKIASIGLRVRKGLAYHGLSFNVCNNLSSFKSINPCGYENLQMTSLSELGLASSTASVSPVLLTHLLEALQLKPQVSS
jgi:lipoyl(octanoyl) transferase